MLGLLLQTPAYCTITDLGGKGVLGSFFLTHSFILSKDEASDKPGAVQVDFSRFGMMCFASTMVFFMVVIACSKAGYLDTA